MTKAPTDPNFVHVNEQAAWRSRDDETMIPRDMTLVCPHCHKEVMHTVRRFREYDACACSACGKHWQVDFADPSSREYFYVVQEKLLRTRELLNGLLGQVTTHAWGRYQTQKDRELVTNLSAGLAYSLRFVNEFIQDVKASDLPEGEASAPAPPPRSISERSNDYPWQFRRTLAGQNGPRLYHGVAFLPTNEQAVAAALSARRRYQVSARAIVIPAGDDYPQERFLVLLPREPEEPLEELRLRQAENYLKALAP